MSNTESDSLVDLLKAWIDTDTWNESAEFLKANVEQLLSDEAIVALDLMIKEHEASGGESAGDLQYLEVLQQHRTILEASQAHSIAEVYEELLKRIELERLEAAVEALAATKSPAELLEQIQHHPVLLTEQGFAFIDWLLEGLRQSGQEERVGLLEERYETLKQIKANVETMSEPIPADLLQLIQEWIDTDTWEQSRAMLKAHAERLLSDEALRAVMQLLATMADKDEKAVQTLLRHRAILEKARAESVDAAYAELLKPSPFALALEKLPDEIRIAIELLMTASNSQELIEQVKKDPILLTEEGFSAIESLLEELRQVGEERIARGLQERYDTLKQLTTASEESEDDPTYTIANALARANTPWQVQQVIAQYPTLLEDETINQLFMLADRVEQDGKPALAQILRLRLNEVQRICQQREQPQQTERAVSLRHNTSELSDIIKSDRGSIAASEISGTITQINQTFNALPERQWLQPGRQSFTERRSFVGRQNELNTLLHYLSVGENVAITGTATKAAALQGMGGIGKTYLAQRLAIELQDQFPGGCILIKLGPQVQDQISAQFPLGELAKYAFGGQIPATPVGQLQPEIVRAWLEDIAPGRLLVVLDDVWNPAALSIMDQALPAKAVRLVTTRHANIATLLGGHWQPLDRLTREDSLALLIDRLGVWNDPGSQTDLEQLVKLLEGHAMALDIIAARIKKPQRLRSILNNLQKEIGRGVLAALNLGEGEARETSVEKSLALSYDMMNSEQKRHFRALGVFEAETLITPEVASAVWNIEDLDAVKNALFELEDLALLAQAPGSGELCYQQHGLLRTYAHALLDKAGELTSISWAHAHYYTELVAHTGVADRTQMDQHLPNILAALEWTTSNEPSLFARLLSQSFQYLNVRGYSTLLESYLPQAITAATATGNQIQQANLLQSLGDLESRLGNIDQARAHYDAALPLYRLERARLGEASIYRRLADSFLNQEDLMQAKVYYEQALSLFIVEREPIGQANSLFGLGRINFATGEYEQGKSNIQQAAELYRRTQDEESARNAERYLAEMHAQLEQPSTGEEAPSAQQALIEALLATDTPQAVLQLARQHPQLLSDEWLALLESLINAQTDEGAKKHIEARYETLKQIREATDQGRADVAEAMKVLIDFANANWSERHSMLNEHGDVLLNEGVEALCDLLQESADAGAVEPLRILLRRSRTYGVDATWYFEMNMRLGDGIEIPSEYEPIVMQVAALLARQQDEKTALTQAIEIMQELLDRLTVSVPPLFEAALLRDLAYALFSLPQSHPARRLDLIEAHYRKALPDYQKAERPISVAFIKRALGDVLSEQGRDAEALDLLREAIETLRADEYYRRDTAWTLSSYASILDNLGQIEEALAAYDEAITLLSDTPPLLRNRAETLIHARRLDKAEADVQRAVELDGNEESPYLWYRRAQLALAQGVVEQAERMIEEVRQRDANHDVTFLQAQCAWLRGDIKQAKEYTRQATEKVNKGGRGAMLHDLERLHSEHEELVEYDALVRLLIDTSVDHARDDGGLR